MPIHKHRRVEDLPPPGRGPVGVEGLRSACELAVLCQALGRPWRLPRGVHRFRSVAEADAQRRAWETQAARSRGDAGQDGSGR